MSKSKNKTRSEIEHLRGQVRQLKAELKYYKKREHLINDDVDDFEYDDVQEISASQCQVCRKGLLLEYDFVHAILIKCDHCDFKTRKKK